MECTRRIHFDSAHRVMGHQNKCQYLHGHRYVLEITATSNELNDLGMVVDFGELKEIMKTWIDQNFDHNIILCKDDDQMGDFIAEYTKQKVYYIDTNPTAENILLHLKSQVIPKIFTSKAYKISKMRLYETPNVFVEIE
ncbi:MAG: hypothetical protein DGJ47_000954 [Rickettsiaceae bacterium]